MDTTGLPAEGRGLVPVDERAVEVIGENGPRADTSIMNVTAVRPYYPGDRPAIEDIAYRTGFMGESAETFWRHQPSFVSIWVAPYLDTHADSAFVATVDGKVTGYLTGCVETAGFEGPDKMLAKAISRHWLLFRRGVAGFLWRAIADQILDKARGYPPVRGELHDARWPSHLHINLLPEARGSALGRALMEAWFARLKDVGSPGCHLGVIGENRRGVAFFTAMGFERHGEPLPIPGMRGRGGDRLHQQMMVCAMSGRRLRAEAEAGHLSVLVAHRSPKV
jgi:ribosomal protein S18 acetylase RimI-like enzyme